MDSLARLAPLQARTTVGFVPPALMLLERDELPSCPEHQPAELDIDPPPRHAGGLAPWQIKRVRTYVEDHLAERVSLEVVATLVRLSASHFSRSFGKSLGLPFGQFVAHKRVAHAQVLMTTTDRQLCDIALTCGFADQSHFSRTFARLVGVTPARWRRRF